MSLVFDLSTLSETQRKLYDKLSTYKGLKLNISNIDAPRAILQSLAKNGCIFIGSKGGIMVFTSQEDVDKNHPVNLEKQKAESVDRFLKFKEVQEMLTTIAQEYGINTLENALRSLVEGSINEK